MASIADLKKALVEANLISEEDFDLRAKESGDDLATLAARFNKDKMIQPQVLNDYLLNIFGYKYISLDRVLIQPQYLSKIPKEFSIEHEVLAFGENGYKLQVAMINPSDLYAVEYVRKRTGQELEIYLTDISSFQSVIKGFKSDIQNLFSNVLQEGQRAGLGSSISEVKDVKGLAEGVPVTKAVNSIIEFAVSEGTSDIHVEPTENEVIVRFRIDGVLHDMLLLTKSIHPVIVARIKIMANLKIDEHRRPQDGRIKMKVNDLPISLRVSILPTYTGEKIVIRILDESARSLTLKDIGFRGKELDDVEGAIQRPDGLILVTGPTGSGKTTTLYTVMKILNQPGVNINTIEDPIEYAMPRINQTQVNKAIEVTFANGLRALLRQDPDIIMVGEIRDEETANMAIHSSMTGHLVLSTLHTNDAPGAVPRFLDMGVEPFLLASTLQLVIAQRLVRKLIPETREKVKMDPASKQIILDQLTDAGMSKEEIEPWLKIPLYNPQPAPESPTGYKGRVAIFEVLKVTDEVRQLILQKAPGHEIRKVMKSEGSMPMFANGLEQVKNGVTTLTEIMRVAKE